MKIPASNEAFNLVSLGAWNPAIFSPEWAKKNIADNKDKDVVLAIPMSLPIQLLLPPRLTVDDVNIFATGQTLVFECVEFSDEGIESCLRKFSRISELLPHTPITAVGVNYRFDCLIEESVQLSDLFSFSDAPRINAQSYPLKSATIKRAYALQDDVVFNLSAEMSSDKVRMEFNYHADVSSLVTAAAKMNRETVFSYRDQAIRFMQEVYGIGMDA